MEPVIDSTAPASPDEGGPSPGARLRAAREARGLGLEAAARSLNLEPAVLRRLEAGDHAGLGAPVFVKGYLRSYATLLGLDYRPLVEAWQRSDPASQQLPDMIRVRERPMVGRPTRLRPLPLLALAVAGLLAFALRDLVPVTGSEAPPPEARLLGEQLPVLVMPPPPAPLPQAAVVPPADAAEAGPMPPPAAPEALAALELPAAARRIEDQGQGESEGEAGGPSRLVLRFAEASWVEVSDRRGRLLYGEQPAGSRRELRGQPPFQLVLGNAPGVELEIDGEPFPLAEQGARGNVLRLAIGGGQ